MSKGVWGRGVLVGLWAVLLVGLVGCPDGPRSLSIPKDGEVVAAFPASGAEARPQRELPKEVAVTLAEPTGVIHTLRAVNVAFNQPMEINRGDGPAAIQISPAIPGTVQWLGEQTVSFLPSKPLPMATRFVVTVPKGLRSRAGAALEADRTFEFTTPNLRVVRFDPSWYNARLRPDESIFVQFNLPVSLIEVKEALVLTTKGQPVSAEVAVAQKDKGGDRLTEGTAFYIKPVGGFTSGTGYELSIEGNLKPREGALTLGARWARNFSTYGPFNALRARCGWSQCTPDATWTVEFSNPVSVDKIKDCLSVSPRLDLGTPYSYSGARHVTLRPQKVKPGTLYEISVSARCKDDLGNTLQSPFKAQIAVGHYPPRISMDQGIHFMELPAPGEKLRFPVTLLNTPDVRLRMGQLTEASLPKFLGSYRTWSSGDEFKSGAISATVDRPFGVKMAEDVKKTYAINLGEALGKAKAGVVFMDLQSKSFDSRYSYGGTRYHKSILQVTDIGLTAKYSPESVVVWATSLSKAEPLPGVRVAMRDVKGELLWEGKTDAEGLAVGPGLKTFGGKKPRVLLANKGEELSFIDLDSWNMQMEPYRFNLPYDWDAPAVALRGHIFTERGVYRPGEKAHVKGYLRVDKGRKLELLPVDRARVTVKDSMNNVVIDREVRLSDLDGFDVEVPLGKGSPLGTWRVEAVPVGLDGGAEGKPSGSFRVEAYRAPDFEVVVGAVGEHVIVGDKAAVTISGQYLFGAPMGGAKMTWSASRRESAFRPVNYEQYAFGESADRYWWAGPSSEAHHIADGQGELSGAGLYEQVVEIGEDESMKGAQEMVIEATVQDINRQVVAGQARVKLHPGDYYIGLKRPGYLVESGKKISMDVVAVGLGGEALAGRRVKVELQKRVWTSVRKAMAGGGTTWVTEKKDKTLAGCDVQTRETARGCDFDIPSPGYYVVRATGKDGEGRKVETAVSLYAWGGGWSWWGSSDDERIDLIADKQRYKVGQKARIMIKSPFREARALVTVERRGILTQRTVELKGSASTIEVPVTEEMLPNAYVSVVLIRGREDKPGADDGTAVDPGKPAFKIGYVALDVDRSEKVLSVSIEPERKVYRPGETVSAEIFVKDSQGNPVRGEMTFMAVDEGVLSLTGYKTPDPVADFYRKASLAVITAESRMAVVARVEAEDEEDGEKGDEGGGGEGGGASTNFRAAFATTAAFMPTVVLDDAGRARVSFELPDNLTAFRLMAVGAASDNRFGSSDTRIQVQKPLMLRPALPRFASTSDRFEVRAVVQAIGESAGKVKVEAHITGPVELIGEQSAVIELARGQIREVVFPAIVGAPGEATFRFVARAVDGFEGEDAVEMKIPVRFPAVTRSMVESGSVQASKERSLDRVFKRLNLPEGVRSDVGGLDIELSSSAISDLMPGLDYLIGYPYGCVEQTTGRTLPLVFLHGLIGDVPLPGVEEGEVMKFAQAGVDRLLSMQTYEGGLGYWPGDDNAHSWGSAYGGLALVKASRTEGLVVDPDKLDKLVGYLREVLRGNVEQESWWRRGALDNTQAFAAYVLAEADEAEQSYHSRLFEQRSSLGDFGKGLLAMAIMRSGGEDSMARVLLKEMLEKVALNGGEASLKREDSAQYYWEIMDSDVRSNSIALMALMMARPQDELVAKFARGLLASRKGSRWISTQENAFAVMSLASFFHATEKGTPDYTAFVGFGDEIVMEAAFKTRGFVPRRLHIPMKALLAKKGEVLTLAREGQSGPLYYTLKLSYAPAKPPVDAFDNGFTIKREYLAHGGLDKGKPISSIKPGEVVKVRLTIVAPTDRHYVAIADPLPSGLEPINTSFATTAPSLAEAVDRENKSWDNWDWWYDVHEFDRIEQQDDRVLLFADFLPGGVYTHTYLARATALGVYTVPAAFAEEMYDPEVFGRTEAFTFEVK